MIMPVENLLGSRKKYAWEYYCLKKIEWMVTMHWTANMVVCY